MNDPTAVWKKRIAAARQRREQHRTTWAQYAMLHAKSYQVQKEANDDESVLLPNGDQVKLGLVFSNVEQTMAVLELPEIGIRATVLDYTRETGEADTHRESVVEQALLRSVYRSGLLNGPEEIDAVKRDGVIVGHGVLYTSWRLVERDIELEPVLTVAPQEDGAYAPVLDAETGEPVYAPRTEKRLVWEGVNDAHVPVTEFLFESSSKNLHKARWHGWEKVVKLEDLKSDPRYAANLPEDLEPQSYIVRDLYGFDSQPEETAEPDSVRLVTVWDKTTATLLTFLESPKTLTLTPGPSPAGRGGKAEAHGCGDVLLIGEEPWPLTFRDPDASPFSFFIPIPANDSPFGISQIEHVRNPATEADKIRTRQANITRQQKRIFWHRKGILDEDQFAQAIQKPDMAHVALDIPDDTDLSKAFGELPMPHIHADLYQQESKAADTVRQVSGISEVPWGGASTATESENMMQVGGARVQRKRRLLLKFLSEVLGKHRDFLREFAPDGQSLLVMTPDGQQIPQVYGRDAFQGEIEVQALPGGESFSVSPVQQKIMTEISGMALGRFGPEFDAILMRQILTKADFRDINAMLRAIQRAGGLMPPTNPAPGGVDVRARAGGPNLNDYTDGQAIRGAVNLLNES